MKVKGFTLIELLVTIVIVAILAAFAVPSYVSFLARGKLVSATEELSAIRGMMEQAYVNDRTYLNADGDACVIANFDGEYFSHSCGDQTRTTFTWTATSMSSAGIGDAGDFVYTIDQDGVQVTSMYKGSAPSVTEGWIIRD